MKLGKILFAMVVISLFIGSACAAGVNDFKVDDAYQNVYSGEYYSVYSHNDDSGILIFKNVDDDVYDDIDNDDVLDDVIQHDGRDYLHSDDDFTLEKNSDNTAKFTDSDHATKGVSEVIEAGGEQYIVVSWAKDSANVGMDKLASMIDDFNKDNGVSPVAF